jgi:hypothetical protein
MKEFPIFFYSLFLLSITIVSEAEETLWITFFKIMANYLYIKAKVSKHKKHLQLGVL